MKSQEDLFIEDVGHRIDLYSTALLRLKADPSDPRTEDCIGSGTFVSIGQQFGILTAQHVVEALNPPCKLGLILMHELHRFSIDSERINIIEIAAPDRELLQPDLAFIGLHQPDVGTIKAHKQFVNLSAERQNVLKEILPINKGAWFIWGIAGEQTVPEPPEKGYQRVLAIHGACSATVASKEEQVGEHDYINVEVEYDKGFDLPNSFGGYSGGGIWQVTIEESADKTLTPKEFIYSGVTIYQSERKNEKRHLRCHGRRSIYEYAYNVINDQNAK